MLCRYVQLQRAHAEGGLAPRALGRREVEQKRECCGGEDPAVELAVRRLSSTAHGGQKRIDPGERGLPDQEATN